MKKLLLSLFCCMLMALSIYAETKTYTYDFSSNTNWVTSKGGSTNVGTGTSNKLNAFYYKDSGDEFNAGGAGYFNDSGYFLWGKSGKYIQLPTFEGEKITNVTATGNPKGSPSTNVKVGIYNEDNVVVSAVQWATKGAEYSYDIPEEYQSSVLRLQVTSDHNCQTVKIVITTETSESGDPTLIDPEISWSESSVTTTTSATDFVAPTLTNANNLAVTYSSSDEAVATVNEAGAVTIVGAGTTTIKATWDATETYKGGSASYTLNVLNAVATLTEFINAVPTTNTIITGAVTVYYQSSDKRYTFITDGTSNLQVYGTLNNAYSNGDQLTGIIGKMGAYGGMSQMVPDVTSFGTATAGTPVEPKAATLAEEIAPCDYVVLTGINLSDISGKSCTLSDGTSTLTGYNRFDLTLVETENATITGIGAVYNETKQLYIISVEGGDVVLELGAIMYQDFALDQNHICGAFVGTPVVFSAENAESIKYTVGETSDEASSSSITWTPTEVGSFNATVTATLGEETKTVNFTINVSEGSAPDVPDTADATYVKVTETPADWSGKYLIVYEDGNLAFDGSLETTAALDAAKNTIDVVINDGMIVSSAEVNASSFTIESDGASVIIQSAAGHYIGTTSDSNGLNANKNTKYTNTITIEDDGTAKITSSAGAVLRFNAADDQMRFRYYKSSSYTGQKAIALYKYTVKSDDPSTAITEIEAADNEAAQWYDLNGRRVAAPGKGIYILRQGNKASKHVF